MFRLAVTGILRRPLRSGLTAFGVAVATALLALIQTVGGQYRSQLMAELSSMGLHLMLVPLGCPYDAAARVLKGNVLETSLPEDALGQVRQDPAVELAAPLLVAAIPRPEQGRTDLFVGLDTNGVALKKWWRAARGSGSFATPDSIVLGVDAAAVEMREPGDKLHSPETGRTFTVAGVLERSGTSDDSLFFIPLATAQEMFHSPGRLTAIAVRLRDPAQVREAAARLGEIPGAQAVTQTEMMGTFLNILGAVQTLLASVVWVSVIASAAAVCNTLLMSVAERSPDFSLFRAIGASRRQILGVVFLEALLLTGAGVLSGMGLGAAAGGLGPVLPAELFPFSPQAGAVAPDPLAAAAALGAGTVVALVASLFPAWRASRAEPADVLKGAG